MINVGTLVKSVLGKQTTNGVLNQGEVRVDTAGPRAQKATLEKIEKQSSLRIAIKQARPGIFYRLTSILFSNDLLVSYTSSQLCLPQGISATFC